MTKWKSMDKAPLFSRQEVLLSDGKQFEIGMYTKITKEWLQFPSLKPLTIQPLWWTEIDIPVLPDVFISNDSHA